jgi:hypothetical protein
VKNPFGGELPPLGPRNPFAEEGDGRDDPASIIEHASARIRRLKGQVGSDGLTLAATRELLDQVTMALDAVARALRQSGR